MTWSQEDSSNIGHPLKLYTDPNKNNLYSTGVSISGMPGSPGAYTQLAVSDNTPANLYYQCSSHGYMGWKIVKIGGTDGTQSSQPPTQTPTSIPSGYPTHTPSHSPSYGAQEAGQTSTVGVITQPPVPSIPGVVFTSSPSHSPSYDAQEAGQTSSIGTIAVPGATIPGYPTSQPHRLIIVHNKCASYTVCPYPITNASACSSVLVYASNPALQTGLSLPDTIKNVIIQGNTSRIHRSAFRTCIDIKGNCDRCLKNASGTNIQFINMNSYTGGFGRNEIADSKLVKFYAGSVSGGIAANSFSGSSHFHTFESQGKISGYLDPQGFNSTSLNLFRAQCIDNNPKYPGTDITDCDCKFANCKSELSPGEIGAIAVGSLAGVGLLVASIIVSI